MGLFWQRILGARVNSVDCISIGGYMARRGPRAMHLLPRGKHDTEWMLQSLRGYLCLTRPFQCISKVNLMGCLSPNTQFPDSCVCVW